MHKKTPGRAHKGSRGFPAIGILYIRAESFPRSSAALQRGIYSGQYPALQGPHSRAGSTLGPLHLPHIPHHRDAAGGALICLFFPMAQRYWGQSPCNAWGQSCLLGQSSLVAIFLSITPLLLSTALPLGQASPGPPVARS